MWLVKIKFCNWIIVEKGKEMWSTVYFLSTFFCFCSDWEHSVMAAKATSVSCWRKKGGLKFMAVYSKSRGWLFQSWAKLFPLMPSRGRATNSKFSRQISFINKTQVKPNSTVGINWGWPLPTRLWKDLRHLGYILYILGFCFFFLLSVF